VAPSLEELPDEIVNSIGMKLRLIKPGSFLMGAPKGEIGTSEDEQPVHSVEISRPFYLGVYPVTQAEYVQVTSLANPSWFSKEGAGKSAVDRLDTSRFPVEKVSWDEAAAFCEALNHQDATKPAWGKYALPTEAEWEYACRAETKTAYFFGGDSGELGNYAWYAPNSDGRTHAVGTRRPNPWGLFDMHGNVWQWCIDYYDAKYYQNSSNKDPRNSLESEARVLRGGSWNNYAENCRAAYRGKNAPGYRGLYLGFRVCFRLD
jgi:formylglycine-generating enzyme required for sulfatase activity